MKQMIQQLVLIRTINADQVGHQCLWILETGTHKTLNEWEMQKGREQIMYHCDLANGVVGNRETDVKILQNISLGSGGLDDKGVEVGMLLVHLGK